MKQEPPSERQRYIKEPNKAVHAVLYLNFLEQFFETSTSSSSSPSNTSLPCIPLSSACSTTVYKSSLQPPVSIQLDSPSLVCVLYFISTSFFQSVKYCNRVLGNLMTEDFGEALTRTQHLHKHSFF